MAKVGGLLALLKFCSFFLRLHHQRAFEAEYIEESHIGQLINDSGEKTDSSSFRDVFTFDRIKEVIETVKIQQ